MHRLKDLYWERRDLQYRSSVAWQLARYALRLDYDELPPAVVGQAKRSVLDALGCAIGAYYAPGRAACERAIRAVGGVEEATTFGTGIRTSALNATVVNSFLTRYLDFNDGGGGGHNSDAIPAILAVAERQHAGGRSFLTAVVASYELGARITDSLTGPALTAGGGSGTAWKKKGLNFDARAALSMPPVLGRLLGLSEEEIANAVGISASHSFPLYILDSCQEELTMAKNLRFGFGSYHAILSCLLAKEGFTGPIRVVEGHGGVKQGLLDDEMDLEALLNFNVWRILDTKYKTFAASGGNRTHLAATHALVVEHDLGPADIESVTLHVPVGLWRNNSYLGSWRYPRNGETADHSAYFTTASIIARRTLGAEAYREEHFDDPVIIDLAGRVHLKIIDDAGPLGRAAVSVILTRDGRRLVKRIEVPHGIGDDPVTDGELEEKFRTMAEEYMDTARIDRIIECVWTLEDVADVTELASLMVFPHR